MAKKQVSSYAQKLKDLRWQKLRLEILNRDEWACRSCGDATNTLHVHHGYYERGREPWEYDPRSLHTLCEECHLDAGATQQDINFFIGMLSPEAISGVHEVLRVLSWVGIHDPGELILILDHLNDLMREHERATDKPGYAPQLAIRAV